MPLFAHLSLSLDMTDQIWLSFAPATYRRYNHSIRANEHENQPKKQQYT